jgi:phage protein D
MRPTVQVTIDKVSGFRQLTIEGTATEARQFIGLQRTRAWENTTEFEVAEQIAQEWGYREARTKDIDQGDIHVERRGISQTGETDMEFLLRIATRIGCTFYMTNGVFHFHQRRLSRAPLKTITYWDSDEGEVIGDPKIEFSIKGRPGRVRRAGHNARERRDTTGAASNRKDTGRPVLGRELQVADPEDVELHDVFGIDLPQSVIPAQEEAQSEVSPTAATSDAEAQSEARQAFRSSERQSLKIELTLVGDPTLKADNTIRVAGIGQKFSGNYYLDEVVDKVAGEGYRTVVKLKRNATSRSRGTSRTRARNNAQISSEQAATEDDLWNEFQEILASERPTDAQGMSNTNEPPDTDVEQVETTDPDGEPITRYRPRSGELPQSRRPEPWEEDW